MYGMGGAYIFRFIAIGLGTYLLQFWPIKAIGAAYLVWMSASYFYEVRHPKIREGRMENDLTGFGGQSFKLRVSISYFRLIQFWRPWQCPAIR